jgi:hypothetical protein
MKDVLIGLLTKFKFMPPSQSSGHAEGVEQFAGLSVVRYYIALCTKFVLFFKNISEHIY